MKNDISKINLQPVLKILNQNISGRKYRIIDFEMEYQGIQTYAAIIPSEGLVVSPVVVGNEKTFIATGEMLEEELRLYLDEFGG